MAENKLVLPLLKLRPYQKELWMQWFGKNVRRMSLEWMRRAGKDLFCLNIMIAEAIRELGNYWFILPEAQQIRKAIWEGVTKDGVRYLDYFPESMILKKDQQSMSIHLRDPKAPTKVGSIVSFVGGDRYDKRVGAGLKGAVVSEHSLQKPNLYDLALEPMLKETGGWCIFNYTPRGYNHATDMWDYLEKKEQHIASRLTNEELKLVSEDDINEERARGKPEEIIQQEYYCSREGAIVGSYYGDMLKQYKDHVGNYSYDAGYPVHTLWDLGISDSMAIWFVQLVGRDIYVIDYYENTGYALGHYASVINGKGYMYAMHHLPHDGRQRQMTSTEKAVTIEQQLKNLDVFPIKIHERRANIYGEIQRVRTMISRIYFDAEKTRPGYEALKQYRREFDEKRNVFKDTPLHDWTSHAADAFSILPNIESQVQQKRPMVSRQWNGNFVV